MIVSGCDVGSLTTKAVIMKDGDILASRVILSTANPRHSAEEVMELALRDAKLSRDDVEYSVGTGYGRNQVPFANRVESEISCHGKGAWWCLPSVRTVIDIGGQDAKAIKLDENGNVVRYTYNDKCASGTGRFLEIMAEVLEVKLEDMGEIGRQAKEDIGISSQCVIFAETEIISLVNEGKDLPDILNSLHRAMANRITSLAKSIGVEQDVAITGGVAKNAGVYHALAETLKTPLQALKIDPQINGALGAAILAQENP